MVEGITNYRAKSPLVASRAAILASLVSETADRSRFLHALGIHGDPAATKRRIDLAKRTNEDLGANPYGYERAFKYAPNAEEQDWARTEAALVGLTAPTVLDPTAGGGSIPFEAMRLGLATIANDLNPVAALIQRATIEFPVEYGKRVQTEFKRLAARFTQLSEPKFSGLFPSEPGNAQVLGYLWARTVRCPHCEGLVPLSPNWRLAPDGTGVQLLPRKGKGPGDVSRKVEFGVVNSTTDQSPGTVSGGDATCAFDDCGRLIDGDHIKSEATAGRMGDQLYAIAFKKRVVKLTKGGSREGWERGYRAPRPEDDVQECVGATPGRLHEGTVAQCGMSPSSFSR